MENWGLQLHLNVISPFENSFGLCPIPLTRHGNWVYLDGLVWSLETWIRVRVGIPLCRELKYFHICALIATAYALQVKLPPTPSLSCSPSLLFHIPSGPYQDSETTGYKPGKAELCSIAMTSICSDWSLSFSDTFLKILYITLRQRQGTFSHPPCQSEILEGKFKTRSQSTSRDPGLERLLQLVIIKRARAGFRNQGQC